MYKLWANICILKSIVKNVWQIKRLWIQWTLSQRPTMIMNILFFQIYITDTKHVEGRNEKQNYILK